MTENSEILSANRKSHLFQARLSCALALGIGSSFSLVPRSGMGGIPGANGTVLANWMSISTSIPGTDCTVYAAVVDGSGN